MARAFYHYTITILKKVSFDPELFKKELEKANESLLPQERLELKIWLRQFLVKHLVLNKYLQDSEAVGKQVLTNR